jgi:hypothetical protein
MTYLGELFVEVLRRQLALVEPRLRAAVESLEQSDVEVTCQSLPDMLDLHGRELFGTERQALQTIECYLRSLVGTPAGDMFDRVLAEGACPTKLVGRLLGFRVQEPAADSCPG